MVRTTPAPRIDIAAEIPAFAALAKQTVRLHPRSGPEPPANASKFGGRFLWPQDEPWPICTEPEWEWEEPISPPHKHVYIPVLQLRRDEFPELDFPEGTDLFQLLWCPNDHEVSVCAPVCKVLWRAEAEITTPLGQIPYPTPIEEDYRPHPCQLHPERVTEYPDGNELPEALSGILQQWEAENENESIYFSELSTAPGTKLGGYPHWIQGSWIPDCDCGHAMEHLLTIASLDFFGREWLRWCPIEDIQATSMSIEELQVKYRYLYALQSADRSTGIMLGDAGELYVFICRRCRDWPIASFMQCS